MKDTHDLEPVGRGVRAPTWRTAARRRHGARPCAARGAPIAPGGDPRIRGGRARTHELDGFGTHAKAYVDSGLGTLSFYDAWEILMCVDPSDSLSFSGLKQVGATIGRLIWEFPEQRQLLLEAIPGLAFTLVVKMPVSPPFIMMSSGW